MVQDPDHFPTVSSSFHHLGQVELTRRVPGLYLGSCGRKIEKIHPPKKVTTFWGIQNQLFAGVTCLGRGCHCAWLNFCLYRSSLRSPYKRFSTIKIGCLCCWRHSRTPTPKWQCLAEGQALPSPIHHLPIPAPYIFTFDCLPTIKLGGGFKYFLMFTPTWGNNPIWLIFFKWIETTN